VGSASFRRDKYRKTGGRPTALGLKGLAPALDRPNLSEVYLPANRDECWFVSYDEKEKAVRAFLDKHFTALVILASAFLLAWAIIEYSRANRFEFIRMDSERGRADRSAQGICVRLDKFTRLRRC
jgi:hypothetical protein